MKELWRLWGAIYNEQATRIHMKALQILTDSRYSPSIGCCNSSSISVLCQLSSSRSFPFVIESFQVGAQNNTSGLVKSAKEEMLPSYLPDWAQCNTSMTAALMVLVLFFIIIHAQKFKFLKYIFKCFKKLTVSKILKFSSFLISTFKVFRNGIPACIFYFFVLCNCLFTYSSVVASVVHLM